MLQLDIPGHSDVTLEPGDVVINWKGADGWAGLMDRGTQVAIDTRITQDLAQEGMAREIVRHVQELRKKSGLEMEDRIALGLFTSDLDLQAAIDKHREYIASETLVKEWLDKRAQVGVHSVEVKIDGKALMIQLRKV